MGCQTSTGCICTDRSAVSPPGGGLLNAWQMVTASKLGDFWLECSYRSVQKRAVS